MKGYELAVVECLQWKDALGLILLFYFCIFFKFSNMKSKNKKGGEREKRKPLSFNVNSLSFDIIAIREHEYFSITGKIAQRARSFHNRQLSCSSERATTF